MPTNGTNTTGDTLPSRFQFPATPKGRGAGKPSGKPAGGPSKGKAGKSPKSPGKPRKK